MERPGQTTEDEPIPEPLSVNFAAIPARLQQYRQWVAWQYTRIDGETKKPPYNPHTGRLASVRDPATWGSFADVQAAYASGTFSGIGFVLSQEVGIVGVDLDHCISERKISPQARQIIQTLDTYSEVSPSGTGIRLLLSGSLPGVRRRHGTVELYDDLRYLTLTGHLLKTTPKTIQPRQRELYGIYQRLFAHDPGRVEKENTGEEERERQVFSRPDQEVLQKALSACNAQNFRRYFIGDSSLWEGEHARHQSQSETDFTLVLMLLYWTNGDTSQVDRLFRQSGLMREKWTRPIKGPETYGQRLIQDAIRKGKQ